MRDWLKRQAMRLLPHVGIRLLPPDHMVYAVFVSQCADHTGRSDIMALGCPNCLSRVANPGFIEWVVERKQHQN